MEEAHGDLPESFGSSTQYHYYLAVIVSLRESLERGSVCSSVFNMTTGTAVMMESLFPRRLGLCSPGTWPDAFLVWGPPSSLGARLGVKVRAQCPRGGLWHTH